MKKNAKELKNSYVMQLCEQMVLQWDFDGFGDAEVAMTVNLYHWDKRSRDIDNYCKLLLDSMNGILFIDDSQIQSIEINKYYDKKNPRIEVGIWEIR